VDSIRRIAGLDPAIHLAKMMDARVKPAHDDDWQIATAVQAMNKVVKIKWLGGHRLQATFSDGATGEHDFSALVTKPGPMAEPLRDPAYFARVFLEDGAPTWPNSFDMCPDWLRRESKLMGR